MIVCVCANFVVLLQSILVKVLYDFGGIAVSKAASEICPLIGALKIILFPFAALTTPSSCHPTNTLIINYLQKKKKKKKKKKK